MFWYQTPHLPYPLCLTLQLNFSRNLHWNACKSESFQPYVVASTFGSELMLVDYLVHVILACRTYATEVATADNAEHWWYFRIARYSLSPSWLPFAWKCCVPYTSCSTKRWRHVASECDQLILYHTSHELSYFFGYICTVHFSFGLC